MSTTNWRGVQVGPKFGMRSVITSGVLRLLLATAILMITAYGHDAGADDLEAVIRAGKLRHLGIRYANFVVSENAGLDVELVRSFAEHLGVQYEFVETSWSQIIADLSGQSARARGDDVEIIAEAPVRGDLIAAGLTVLAWRQKIVDFSTPTFPTGVWLIAREDSDLQPIIPSGDIDRDIQTVKALLQGKSVLGLQDSCLDPSLYALDEAGALVKFFPGNRNLDEMIPAVMAGMAETTMMDVPVALIALENWPGRIKVIGPLSTPQEMACAFPKSAPNLRRAFDAFFERFKADGNYDSLVRKYYPSVFSYYGSFFKG
ncbi:MAG: transporter substrate-binding domain-containing protein [Desulfobacterales bacterium]